MRCCLHISRYPNIFNELLQLIIIKMLQIDVSIYCYLINYSCMGVFMQVEVSPLFDNEDEALQFNTDDVAMVTASKLVVINNVI